MYGLLLATCSSTVEKSKISQLFDIGEEEEKDDGYEIRALSLSKPGNDDSLHPRDRDILAANA